MKNSALSVSLISTIILISISLLNYSCKKDDPEPTPPAATCSDGIQNQDETGVDCGGSSCTPCPTDVCVGNGSNSYFPLALNNSWTTIEDYFVGSNRIIKEKVTGTTVMGGKTYFVINHDYDGAFINDRYYRVASNGDVYISDNTMGEYLLIPANPSVGDSWLIPTSPDSLAVESTNATLTSKNGCTYTGLLRIASYTNGAYFSSKYYKKGVGKVYEDYDLTIITQYLESLTLN